jgi:hypothetical protein
MVRKGTENVLDVRERIYKIDAWLATGGTVVGSEQRWMMLRRHLFRVERKEWNGCRTMEGTSCSDVFSSRGSARVIPPSRRGWGSKRMLSVLVAVAGAGWHSSVAAHIVWRRWRGEGVSLRPRCACHVLKLTG